VGSPYIFAKKIWFQKQKRAPKRSAHVQNVPQKQPLQKKLLVVNKKKCVEIIYKELVLENYLRTHPIL
jgi:hypothetical protein